MSSRYRSTRQKACYECAKAKARCDLRVPVCTRCARRKSSCSYPKQPTIAHSRISSPPTVGANSATPQLPNSLENYGLESPQSLDNASNQPDALDRLVYNSIATSMRPSSSVVVRPDTTQEQHGCVRGLNFSGLDLVCPIDADGISNRWLNPYVSAMGQKRKDYPANTTAFIYRVLKSYTSRLVGGDGMPSFVHRVQMQDYSISPALFTCRTVARTCDSSDPGSQSVVVDLLNREMDRIYGQYETYDHTALLAAFQAYLLYSMLLCFKLGQESSTLLRQVMANLQVLASFACRNGIVCTAEKYHTRPEWETWIVAEAKRRTVYVMYMFDSMLSAREGMPTFLGSELQGLQAPSSGKLWHARAREDWSQAYNVHLAEWPSGSLSIDELWPAPPEFGERAVTERKRRVDQWLEDVDDFGTMLFAVTCTTHGG